MTKCKVVLAATVPMTAKYFLVDQAMFFAERGIEVQIISSDGAEVPEIQETIRDEPCVTFRAVAMHRRPKPLADIRSLVSWTRLLSFYKPDAVMAGTPKAGLLGMAASFMIRTPNRIYFVHGFRADTTTGLSRWINLTAERLACRMATHILCVSNGVRNRLEEAQLAQPGRVRVLGSGSARGIDTTRFTPVTPASRDRARQTLGIPVDALVIGFAGRLTQDKGIEEILRAVSSLRHELDHIVLLIAGAADESDPLQPANAELLAAPWVVRLGSVSDMNGFYHALDVFCLPSFREGLPTVNLEAAACGIPVVTTDATGCAESVLPGESGLVVPTGDIDALASALGQIVTSPDLKHTMGLRGRLWVEQKFDQRHVLGLQYRFLSDLCSPSGAVRD